MSRQARAGRAADGLLGVEVELLAPAGSSRRTLAEEAAARIGGGVTSFFHMDAEPTAVEGLRLFHNITPAFRIHRADGTVLAWLVDDITLQHDLDRHAGPTPGWWRLVSDDRRLVRLAEQVIEVGPLPDAIAPLARLFGTEPHRGPDGLWGIRTTDGSSVAIAAPLPGERDRPAELVTAPMGPERTETLTLLLAMADELGFTAATEGATHVHLDAAPLRDAAVLRRFVHAVVPLHEPLRALLGTNPHCVRLGPWPDELLSLVEQPGWDALPWTTAAEALGELDLTKYCDVNLCNVVAAPRDKDTVEFRMLPVHLDPAPILVAARVFAELVDGAVADDRPPDAADLERMLGPATTNATTAS